MLLRCVLLTSCYQVNFGTEFVPVSETMNCVNRAQSDDQCTGIKERPACKNFTTANLVDTVRWCLNLQRWEFTFELTFQLVKVNAEVG